MSPHRLTPFVFLFSSLIPLQSQTEAPSRGPKPEVLHAYRDSDLAREIIITSQPQPKKVSLGQMTTFSVEASTCCGNVSYQWFRRRTMMKEAVWTAIEGATSSSFSTPTLTGKDNASEYFVRISNATTTVDSVHVPLTVGLDTTTLHKGEATFYGEGGGGHCSFTTAQPPFHGAMNHLDYDTAAACGTWVKIVGPKGEITAFIDDECPECKEGDIDLGPNTFAMIGDLSAGRIPITWHYVQAPSQDPVKYHWQSGSSQWHIALQVLNHKNGIVKLEMQTQTGNWVDIPRQVYNYFVLPGGINALPGPYNIRITDIFGNQLIDNKIDLVPDAYINGAGNFPAESDRLGVYPDSLSFLAGGETKTTTITSNVAWTATSDSSWLKLSPASAAGSATLTLVADPSAGGTARTAVVTIKGSGLTSLIRVSQTIAVPSAPTGLAATADDARVTLAWVASPGAATYRVYRGTTAGGEGTVPIVTGITSPSYTNTGLTNGITYYYKVTAVNNVGTSAYSSEVSATPTANSTGPVTAKATLASGSGPWWAENDLTLTNTSSVTDMTVTITVQKTPGVSYNGQYNTAGQFSQTHQETASTIVYTFKLNAGQTFGSGSFIFAAQYGGTGTARVSTGDTYAVSYTSGGKGYTLNGHLSPTS